MGDHPGAALRALTEQDRLNLEVINRLGLIFTNMTITMPQSAFESALNQARDQGVAVGVERARAKS